MTYGINRTKNGYNCIARKNTIQFHVSNHLQHFSTALEHYAEDIIMMMVLFYKFTERIYILTNNYSYVVQFSLKGTLSNDL